MIVKMTRVEIIGLKSVLDLTVQTLHTLGCMHIDEIESCSDPGIRGLILSKETLREREESGYLLAQIDGQLEIMGGPSPNAAIQQVPHDLLEQIRAGLAQLTPIMQKLISRRTELDAQLDLLPRYEQVLRTLLPLVPDSARLRENVSTGIFVSRPYADLLDMISHEMFQITGGKGEVVTLDVDADTRSMLLVFPAEFSDEINNLLIQHDVSRLRLLGDIDESSLDAILLKIQYKLQDIPKLISTIDHEISQQGDKWSEALTFWKMALTDRLAAHRILSRFGETESTFVIVGWIPTKDVEHVRDLLHSSVGNTVLLYEVPIASALNQQIPIALENPPVTRSFEVLVRLRALPRYDEIDPSGLMSFFMPIFFGIMLGDIGYGIVLLLLAVWLIRRFKSGMVHSLLVILAVGSIWSIVFGVAFGEIFGTLGEELGLHPLLFDRADPDHLVSLLALTIGVGSVHITLGLILGLWHAWSTRSHNHLLERGGMLIGLVSLFLVAGVLVDLLPQTLITPAFAIMVLGIVLLSVPMGWLGILMGPLEFIGLVGNLLSYLRIAAIGLASVYLAQVANEIAGLVGSIIVGLMIAVLIHALNIALGAFSPSIQSLRLQYVEFFRQFYAGGGRSYEPFKRHLALKRTDTS